jgi:ribosomal protein L40E
MSARPIPPVPLEPKLVPMEPPAPPVAKLVPPTPPADARPTSRNPPPEPEPETYAFAEAPPPPPAAKTPPAPAPTKKTRKPTPRSAPRQPAPEPEDNDNAPREVLISGTVEDDGNPYAVQGDVRSKRCPECDTKLPLRATLCTKCNYNFETGEREVEEFQPVTREWEAGWPFQKRVLVFAIVSAINTATVLGGLILRGDAPIGVVGWFITMCLQTFLIGTYDKLTISRNRKGQVKITKIWRVAFYPMAPITLKWRDHEGVMTGMAHDPDYIDWAMFILLVPFCIFPAVIWWWFIIRPEQHYVALSKHHGSPETMLYRGTKEGQAREIADTVNEFCGLPYQ